MKERQGRDVVGTIKTWELESKSPHVGDTDPIKSCEMFDD